MEMTENPFKIIEPREELPDNLKKEVMGSVKSLVLILRFVQLFVGDFSATLLEKFSRTSDPKPDNDNN